MPGTISQYQVVIPGQTITASLWNGMENNIIDNGLVWSGIDDYSTNDAQMQVQTDPYPAATTSRPTSAQGELERIRHQIAQITGETYWYQDADVNLATIYSTYDRFPSGTKLPFYQASVPTGWTAVAVNDKFIRVVTSGTTGGTDGGTVAASTSLAHTHTVASHTHTGPSHTHTGPSHTHSTPNHTHVLAATGGGAEAIDSASRYVGGDGSEGGNLLSGTSGGSATIFPVTGTTASGGSGTTGADGTGNTGASGTGATGAASPATDSQLGAFAYADFCVGSKD